jgi:hypothetical protein
MTSFAPSTISIDAESLPPAAEAVYKLEELDDEEEDSIGTNAASSS